MRVTADNLEATNASAVPLGWNLVSKCLGKREHLVLVVPFVKFKSTTDLGILCIL